MAGPEGCRRAHGHLCSERGKVAFVGFFPPIVPGRERHQPRAARCFSQEHAAMGARGTASTGRQSMAFSEPSDRQGLSGWPARGPRAGAAASHQPSVALGPRRRRWEGELGLTSCLFSGLMAKMPHLRPVFRLFPAFVGQGRSATDGLAAEASCSPIPGPRMSGSKRWSAEIPAQTPDPRRSKATVTAGHCSTGPPGGSDAVGRGKTVDRARFQTPGVGSLRARTCPLQSRRGGGMIPAARAFTEALPGKAQTQSAP